MNHMGIFGSPQTLWLPALGSALFWTVTYIVVIYAGWRDRTCGMPLAALCANFAWELLLAFVMPFHPVQQIVTVVWFALDCIILLQLFRYTRSAYPAGTLRLIVAGLVVTALLLHIGTAVELHDPQGKYSAFAINLMMSLLFIRMALKHDLLGQSIYIAYAKMLGTLCASLWSYALFPHSVLLNLLYVLILAADLLYIALVHRRLVTVVPANRRRA